MSKSLELEVVTSGISRTKLCPVDGPMYSNVTCDKMSPLCDFISSPEPKAHGELIVYQSSRRPSVCPSVKFFKHEYL